MVALNDNSARKPKASSQRKVSAQSADRLSFMPEVYPENIGMPSVNSDTSVANHITNGSTDYIWQGSQVMEERNSSNAPVRQYIWGTYPGAAALTGPPAQTGFRPENTGLGSLNVDECVQLTTFAALGSQNLAPGSYYLLQDLLYRAVALTDSSGSIVEAYDTDAYGNTLIFTAPDSGGNWWGDSAVQSNYGANEIIYCGYRFDPETDLYYVRNRTYSPVLGRWVQSDPIGYSGGINLYEYVGGRAAGNRDALGLQSGNLPGGNPFQGAWTGLGDFLSTPAGQAALNKLYGFGLGHLTPTGPDTGPGLPAAPKPGGGVSFCPYQTKFPGGGFRINIGSGFGYSWPFNVNASPYINGVVNYGALYAWLQAQGMGSYQGGSFNTGGNVSGGIGWGSLYIAGSTGTGGNVLVGGLSFGF